MYNDKLSVIVDYRRNRYCQILAEKDFLDLLKFANSIGYAIHEDTCHFSSMNKNI